MATPKKAIDTALLRIGLTMGGAIVPALLTGLLKSLLLKPGALSQPAAQVA